MMPLISSAKAQGHPGILRSCAMVNYYEKKKESVIINSHLERPFEKFHVFSKAFQHQEAGDEGLM